MSTVLPDPNRFDLARITASGLVASLDYRPSMPSTQDRAVELARREDLQTPALVLTSGQTAGRGRGGNAWWAEDGALTFSLIVDADEEAARGQADPRQSLAAGLAVCEVVCELAPEVDCGLKWPNDVYLDGRKVCGVLVETVARGSAPDRRTLFGVGVNVNNPLENAPSEVAVAATSLFDATQRHHDLSDLLIMVLRRLADGLAALARSDPEQAEQWQARSLLTRRRVRVRQGTTELEGQCLRIDAEGALLLATDTGRQRVTSGVVEQIDPPLETGSYLNGT
jgi:BirA family biotin operon repressor/biotin-[acetyl-CoA-carboxylase] ligase